MLRKRNKNNELTFCSSCCNYDNKEIVFFFSEFVVVNYLNAYCNCTWGGKTDVILPLILKDNELANVLTLIAEIEGKQNNSVVPHHEPLYVDKFAEMFTNR